MSAFFESPYVASILGFLFGALLIGAYGFTAIKFTGERAKTGLYVSFGLSLTELLLVLGVLLLYRAFANPGAIWFGGAMAAGFTAGFIFLLVRLYPTINKK